MEVRSKLYCTQARTAIKSNFLDDEQLLTELTFVEGATFKPTLFLNFLSGKTLSRNLSQL